MSTNQKFVLSLLSAVTTFISFVVVVNLLYRTGEHNREKTERFTEQCVSEGFSGWSKQLGCYSGVPDE